MSDEIAYIERNLNARTTKTVEDFREEVFSHPEGGRR
jgi:hypothetical protein